MTTSQRKAMEDGRKRWLKKRQRESVKRVDQFREWLRGERELPLPLGMPVDADYERMRAGS